MRKHLFKPALIAALLVGTWAAFANTPQNMPTAANEGSDCGSAPARSAQVSAHYQQVSADRDTEPAPQMIEIMFCEVFTA